MNGTLLCLGSAVAFGTMAIFGKLSYEEGATVGTLLSLRFVLAAGLFWSLVAVTGGPGRFARRDVGIALALGGFGYSLQAGAYFAALDRIDASLLSLLLYTYPALVAVAAVVLGRERMTLRRAFALALTSGGLVMIVAGAGTGNLDAAGVLFAITAAVAYTTYILTSQGAAGRLPPLALSAIVCTGAAVTCTGGAAALGDLHPGALTVAGWGWLACIAAVATVTAIGLFFAGLRRSGPTTAAILSTVEPLVTVVLAFLIFGEQLGPAQLAGGALLLGGVLVLTAPPRPLRPGLLDAAPAQG